MRRHMATKKTNRKKSKMTPEQKRKAIEKSNHMKMIRTTLFNIGFERIPGVAGVHFDYANSRSEFDDVFILENVLLLVEYTTEQNPKDHLSKKSIVYERINASHTSFLQYLISNFPKDSFKQYYEQKIKNKYSQLDQIQVRILYCSRYEISADTCRSFADIYYFDYKIAQYFQSLTKAIKRSSIYEFLDFLQINYNDYADNVLRSSALLNESFKGYVLPESRTSLSDGYKVISFYIDASSLLRRAYVLRQDSWRNEDGIGFYQRMLEMPKINSIRKYLHEERRVFINNIIATIDADDITIKRQYFDKEKNTEVTALVNIKDDGSFENFNTSRAENILIEISDKYNIIGIIDGQHRLYAYHEGNDVYENTISNLRKIQNLLVTCILYPKNVNSFERNRFEANLFLEINKNQKPIRSALQQEIELLVSPFSLTAIGKEILKSLNNNGPLEGKLAQSSYDTHKISTASIVSFGLKPLIKLDETASDSLFRIWGNPDKLKLKDKQCTDDALRLQYVEFCVSKIRDILRAFKDHLSKESKWMPYSPSNKDGILGVVLINGILNVLRILVSEEKVSTSGDYYQILKGINEFQFKAYTSSQYHKMGEDMYEKYWLKQ